MSDLLYILRKSFVNRVKLAMQKAVTYIYLILVIAYLVLMSKGFGEIFRMAGLVGANGFTLILSGLICFVLPSNIITYAKRKGLIFRSSDVHFVFSAPVSPKKVMIYAQMKMYLMSLIISGLIFIAGVVFFKVALWRMLIYLFFSLFIENLLETSMMICLYGNERLPEQVMKWLCRALYIIILAFVGFGLYLYMFETKSFAVIPLLLEHPVVQCIPILGWNIAVIRLLVLGPTLLNVICAGLYLLSAVVLFVMAYRMKCTGDYYEDAAKFADDYEEAISRKKNGEMSRIGKKARLKKADVRYKGYYSRAIFYRQLLEFKKQKFFIFGGTTLLCAAVGAGIAYLSFNENSIPDVVKLYFVLPIAAAYITFIFSGYITKWNKELANPYTYLIPDHPFKKLWYATVFEHIRAAVDGCLLMIPAAVVLGIPPLYVVLDIIFYICLQANKLYFSVLSEALLGNILGSAGKSIMRMVGQAIVITLAIIVAVVVSLFVNPAAGYMALCIYMIGITGLVAWGGAFAFRRMEAL